MDAVRFGRALGAGARAAAKTAVAAADAASAPTPAPARPHPRAAMAVQPAKTAGTAGRGRSVLDSRPASAAPAARAAAASARTTATGVKEGARRFGREVWNPFVRLSGVLWLEVTGVFFGIFALFAFGAAWRLRWAWKATGANTAEHQRLLGAIVMCGVFGYFCISSFVRAGRRQRRR